MKERKVKLPAIAWDPTEKADAALHVRIPRRVYLELMQQSKDASLAVGEHVSMTQLATSKLIAAVEAVDVLPSSRSFESRYQRHAANRQSK